METLLLSFIRRFTTTSSNENKTIEDPEANIEAVENSDAVPRVETCGLRFLNQIFCLDGSSKGKFKGS